MRLDPPVVAYDSEDRNNLVQAAETRMTRVAGRSSSTLSFFTRDWFETVAFYKAFSTVLGVLLARGLNDGLARALPDRRLVLTWFLCVIYAVSDEYHQAFVPGRSSDWRDVLSDAAGTAAGLALLSLAQDHLLPRRPLRWFRPTS